MRAAAIDRRPICPPATGWQLSNGAYLDGPDEIVMPADSSVKISAWVHVGGSAGRFYWDPLMMVESDTGSYVSTAAYYGADRLTRVSNLSGYSTNGAGRRFRLGGWGYPTSSDAGVHYQFDFQLGPQIHWLRLSLATSPGWARYRPQPTDWTFTYL